MIIFFIFLFYWLGLCSRYSLLVIAVVVVFLLIVVFKKYKTKVFLLALGVFTIGVGVSYIKIDIPRTSFSGMVIDSHDNYFLLLSKGEKLYTYNKSNSYEIGDYLTITGEKKKLDFITLESQFDFKDYLNKKGVYYEIDAYSISVKFSNPIRIRSKRVQFLKHFSDRQQSLIGGLLFSLRDDSDDIKNVGALHLTRLISASGVFIYAYLKLLNLLLSKIKFIKHPNILSVILLFPYFIFTFPRFAVIRILTIIFLRGFLRNLLKFEPIGIITTSLAGLLFLLIDFHLAYDISFIMGFSLPFIAQMVNEATFRHKGIKKKFIQAFFMYLAVIPFELYFYNGINPLSFILVAILSPLFIFVAIISLICFYGIPIYPVASFFTNILSNIIGFLAKFSFQINVPPMSGVIMILFIFIFLGLLYYRSIEFFPFQKLFSVLFTVFIVFYLLPVQNTITTEVSFINVGQGDSCLIRKGNTAVLIDTGGLQTTDVGNNVLIPYLKKKRIYDIDLVIVTHHDYDHYGAYDSLKENYYVKDLVTEATSFPLSVGGIKFTNYNLHTEEMVEENDKSLVIGFTLSNVSYVITGDAPKMIERKIIEENDYIPCDILKVGHHGSDTSTSDEFVKFLSPKEAVISCGVNNKYGHPIQSVLNTLNNNGVIIRRTDLEGTITYKRYIFM